MNKTISSHTLGCKLNFAETSTIIKLFSDNGFKKVNFGEKSDLTIINTCTVTAQADKKSRQAIKKAIKNSKSEQIIVIGCYAQIKPLKLSEIEGVDLIIGTKNKFEIFDIVQDKMSNKKTDHSPTLYNCNINEVSKFDAAFSIDDRTRSFLKIQDGCDYNCSYCTIPLARGKSRNAPISEIIEQAKKIAKKGYKEIILTGVNIGDFGKSTGETFFQLIRELEQVENIKRYRISSIEPNLLTDEIISFVSKSDKFLPHFHIPLQNGSDKILKLMQRRYNAELFKNKISKINEIIPDAFIGLDVIVGFPSETDDDFMQTYNLLKNLQISFLHIFPYSERDNTKSINLPNKNDGKIIKQRAKMLKELSDIKHKEFELKHKGKNYNVLFEGQNNNGKIAGYTENYIRIEKDFDEKLVNKIVNCK